MSLTLGGGARIASGGGAACERLFTWVAKGYACALGMAPTGASLCSCCFKEYRAEEKARGYMRGKARGTMRGAHMPIILWEEKKKGRASPRRRSGAFMQFFHWDASVAWDASWVSWADGTTRYDGSTQAADRDRSDL